MRPVDAALKALRRVEHQLQHIKGREVKEVISTDRKVLVQGTAMHLSLIADELQENTDCPHPRERATDED